MKKSELIKLIQETIQNTWMWDGDDKSEPYLDENFCAYKIVELIEDAGMIPPSYIGLMANGKKYNKHTDFGMDREDIRGRWEPEDGEKT